MNVKARVKKNAIFEIDKSRREGEKARASRRAGEIGG